jgi:hypothetical protein
VGLLDDFSSFEDFRHMEIKPEINLAKEMTDHFNEE